MDKDTTVFCVGRRRIRVWREGEQILLHLTLGDRHLAKLLLPMGEAEKLQILLIEAILDDHA